MGFPPAPDAPSLSDQASIGASISFAPAPTGLELCGFKIPSFSFSISFRLPAIPKFDFPPTFNFFLALKCDLSNPIDASFGFGGGRTGNPPPLDDEFD